MSSTIKQIAEIAKVSKGAVSAALSDVKGIRISPKTKAKIIKIAKELNYRPAFAASALKTGRTGLLGFVCGGLQMPFFASLAMELMKEVNKNGMQLIIVPLDWVSHNDFECFMRMIDVVDGLFMYTQIFKDDKKARDILEEKNLPLVLLGYQTTDISSVQFDIESGMRQAFEYLLKMGHRRIAYAGDKNDHIKNAAYHSCCEYFACQPIEYLIDLNLDDNKDIAACGELIVAQKNSYSALISSDYTLSIIVRDFDKSGLKIPEDLSVISFAADTNSVKYFCPPLTSINLDTSIMAYHGMELMKKKYNTSTGSPLHLKNVIVQPTLIERESVQSIIQDQEM